MKKVIIVAKDQAAVIAIDFDREIPDQVIELELTELELSYFFASGLVDELNQTCNSMIDNFEATVISGYNNLIRALQVVEGYQYRNLSYSGFISNLIDLFQEAIIRNTAVYFYF